MKTLSIIGVGWLGKQMLEHFQAKGHTVFGLGRSLPEPESKMQFFLDLNADEFFWTGEESWLQADLFVFTVPPSGLKSQAQKLKVFLEKILEFNSTAQILFCSSIGVYDGCSGVLDETTALKPQSDRAKGLVQMEQVVLDLFKDYACILRLGGLVGPGRHPVHFLAGRSKVKGGLDPINLIHSEDILQFVAVYAQGEGQESVYNLVSPMHPPKQEYYASLALEWDLPQPSFQASHEKDRKIDSIFLKALNFNFLYSDPACYPKIKIPS